MPGSKSGKVQKRLAARLGTGWGRDSAWLDYAGRLVIKGHVVLPVLVRDGSPV